MSNQETLEREIYLQGEIIKGDQAGIRSPRTSIADRILLQLQIGIRKAITARLMRRRGKLPSA